MKALELANRFTVPKSRGLRFGDLLKELVEQMEVDRTRAYAGNLAYRGLFAIFAVAVLLMALLSVFAAENLIERVMDQISGFMPDPVHEAIEGQVLDQAEDAAIGRAPSLRVAIAVLAAMYGLSALARGVTDAMNAMYRVDERRPFWRRQAFSIAMCAVVLALLIGAMVLLAVGAAWGPLPRILRWPVLLLLIMLAFDLVYYFAPAVEERFRLLSHGALLALPVWVLFSLGFSFFVENFGDFERTYGALAGVMVLLVYMFLSSLILLAGAEVNHVVARHTGRKARRRRSRSRD